MKNKIVDFIFELRCIIYTLWQTISFDVLKHNEQIIFLNLDDCSIQIEKLSHSLTLRSYRQEVEKNYSLDRFSDAVEKLLVGKFKYNKKLKNLNIILPKKSADTLILEYSLENGFRKCEFSYQKILEFVHLKTILGKDYENAYVFARFVER